MRLVQSELKTSPRRQLTTKPLSVIEARRLLRDVSKSKGRRQQLQQPAPIGSSQPARGVATAWFNPWTYQSGEQVWAGLARAVTDAAIAVLCTDEDSTQRYWFTRNISRLDRHALRRRLWWRALSPAFAFSVAVALAPILINLTNLHKKTLLRVEGFRLTPGMLALIILIVVTTAAIVNTVMRFRGRAASFLPAEVIRGPVVTGVLAEGGAAAGEALRDPLYYSKIGYLRLIREDITDTLADLDAADCDLVVFIDDLDRCSARTTAEVFEAINLFLSDMRARFVLGLDPDVVAAHLNVVYKDLASPQLAQYGDDPSAGWAFLRKVVQLPVRLPRIGDEAIDRFVADAVAVPPAAPRVARAGANADHPDGSATARSATAGVSRPEPAMASADGSASELRMISAAVGLSLPAMAEDGPHQLRQRKQRKGPVEQQPEVLALITERLAAQPERSSREAKRLLNVWQFYQRLFDSLAPLRDDEAQVERACQLVILAEIITRWPAVQHQLHQTVDGRRVLQHLATAADYDSAWEKALSLVDYDPKVHAAALDNLRNLLRAHENPQALADLAARAL